MSRWPGSTAWTSRSCTTPTPGSSSSAPSASPTRPPRTSPAPSGSGPTRACARCRAWMTPRSSPIAAYRWEHTDRALRRAAAARGRGPPGHRVPGPRRRPLHQPHHRRGRHADHPGRVPPAARRRRAPTRPRGRLQRLAGLRRLRLRGPRRRNQDPGEGRPLRRPVLGRRGRCRPETEFDLFRFSDAPIFERLNFNRTYIEGRNNVMRLLTLRTSDGTTVTKAVRQDGDTLTEIDGFADVGELLRTPGLGSDREGGERRHAPARGRRPRRRRPLPRQDHLRGPQLPQPHQGNGPGSPRVPHPVRQVPGIPDRPRTMTWPCRRNPTPWTGKPNSPS